MSGQLPLAIGLRPRPTLEHFVTGDNRLAVQALNALLDADDPDFVYLTGASGTGKTHLLLATCEAAEQQDRRVAYLPLADAAAMTPEVTRGLGSIDLIALDDLDRVVGDATWEEALFHLFNALRSAGNRLLVAADRGPLQLDCGLQDLGSRLASGVSFRLQALNDADRLRLLENHACARGLELAPDAARWILSRQARNPGELTALIARLDSAALAAQRRQLTLPFVRSQLG